MWQFHIGIQGCSFKRNCVPLFFQYWNPMIKPIVECHDSHDHSKAKVLRWSLQGQIPSWPTGRTSILSNKGIQYLRDAFSSCHHQYHHPLNHLHQQLTPGQCPTGTRTWPATRPQNDFYCGASSHSKLFPLKVPLNFTQSSLNILKISSNFLKFPLKFSISSQPGWQAGTIKATDPAWSNLIQFWKSSGSM